MTRRNDSWSGSWCKEKLDDYEKVDSIELIGSNLISINHSEHGKIYIATMSLSRIDETDLREVIQDQKIDFVLNVSKEPYITQRALFFAEVNGFSIGGLGDAMKALRNGDFSNYLNPEISFVLRGLRQHTRVSAVIRLDNRRFQIERVGLPTVTVLALNEYDLTAESVRSAIDQFPKFDAILKSNPNGRITTSCITAANSAGVKVFGWGELLGKLNKHWT